LIVFAIFFGNSLTDFGAKHGHSVVCNINTRWGIFHANWRNVVFQVEFLHGHAIVAARGATSND
jgi:hypothetical protein